MQFFKISTAAKPYFHVTGRLYNQSTFGLNSSPPDPGNGYARIMENGKKWHDCHQTTAFARGVYGFSERVAIGIQKAKLTGIEFYPMEFEFSENKHLKVEDAPPYYWGLVTGRIAVKETKTEKDWTIYDLDLEDWDGSDFVAFREKQTGHRFCSERFIKLISNNQWTGFQLIPLKDGHILDRNRPPIKFPYLG